MEKKRTEDSQQWLAIKRQNKQKKRNKKSWFWIIAIIIAFNLQSSNRRKVKDFPIEEFLKLLSLICNQKAISISSKAKKTNKSGYQFKGD
jgi:hypothetical protein